MIRAMYLAALVGLALAALTPWLIQLITLNK